MKRGSQENVRQLFGTDHTNKLYFPEDSNKAIKSVDLTTGAINNLNSGLRYKGGIILSLTKY